MARRGEPQYPAVVGNYQLAQKLGAGYSGAIFRARHVHTGQWVALKLQPIDEPCPTNRYERGFYPALQGGKGMPTLWGGGQQGRWDYLAIDLLGASLDSLDRRKTTDVWDLRSVCCVAMQVMARLEFMHTQGILHRDIQLGNCVLGLEPDHTTIYMIDFGFSKFFIDPYTKRHIPDSKEPRDFIGNYWFSSVRVHCRGQVPSRRDDIEALALMLIHMLTPGGLSWTRNGVPKTDEAHDRLIREKRNARPEDLCRGLPPPFEELLRYARRLQFTEIPDYERWIDEFRELADERGFPSGSEFVWPPPEPEPTVRVTAAPKVVPAQQKGKEMEGVLKDLAKLQLGERPPLGAVHVNGPRATPLKESCGKALGKGTSSDAIELSSSDEENSGLRDGAPRLPKAARLAKLAAAIGGATDNGALGRLVGQFVEVMQETRSRTLTREGFAVLDALHKQLADPSVFVTPMRTSRSRGSGAGREEGVETRQGKMSKLVRLRTGVQRAKSNGELARMVAEFGGVINGSNGRTVTKDGLGFLENLAATLRARS